MIGQHIRCTSPVTKALGWIALALLIVLVVLISPSQVLSKEKMGLGGAGAPSSPMKIPQHLSKSEIEALVAGMDDTQVRQLLLTELKKRVSSPPASHRRLNPVAQVVERVGAMSRAFKRRLMEIRSGARAAPKLIPQALIDYPGPKKGLKGVILMFLALLILFAGGVAVEWVYMRAMAD